MANDGERGLGPSCVNTNIDEFILKNNMTHTYPEESKARSRIPKNANDEKYVRGTSSAQGTIDSKSVLMTAGPSRHSGEEEQPVPHLRSALQYR